MTTTLTPLKPRYSKRDTAWFIPCGTPGHLCGDGRHYLHSDGIVRVGATQDGERTGWYSHERDAMSAVAAWHRREAKGT